MCRNIKSHVCVLVISMTEAMMLCWYVLHQFSYASPAYMDSLMVCMKTTWRSYRVYWNVLWSLHVGLEDLSVTLFWRGSLLNTSEMRWDQQPLLLLLKEKVIECLTGSGRSCYAWTSSRWMFSWKSKTSSVPVSESLKYQTPKPAAAKRHFYLLQKSFHGDFLYRMWSNSK